MPQACTSSAVFISSQQLQHILCTHMQHSHPQLLGESTLINTHPLLKSQACIHTYVVSPFTARGSILRPANTNCLVCPSPNDVIRQHHQWMPASYVAQAIRTAQDTHLTPRCYVFILLRQHETPTAQPAPQCSPKPARSTCSQNPMWTSPWHHGWIDAPSGLLRTYVASIAVFILST